MPETETVGTAFAFVNAALELESAETATVQSGVVPLQPPLHPVNTHPGFGIAVMATLVSFFSPSLSSPKGAWRNTLNSESSKWTPSRIYALRTSPR